MLARLHDARLYFVILDIVRHECRNNILRKETKSTRGEGSESHPISARKMAYCVAGPFSQENFFFTGKYQVFTANKKNPPPCIACVASNTEI